MTPGAREVRGRIDSRVWGASRDRNADAYPVRERAQLLERFAQLDRRRVKPREVAQERRAIRIDAEMTVGGQACRDGAYAFGECIARVGNGSTAEIERIARAVEHDLDDVRIGKLPRMTDRVR